MLSLPHGCDFLRTNVILRHARSRALPPEKRNSLSPPKKSIDEAPWPSLTRQDLCTWWHIAVRLRMILEPQPSFSGRIWRHHELFECLEKVVNLSAVCPKPAFKLFKFCGQVLMKCESLAHRHESSNDLDIYESRLATVEDAREHRHALFRENVRLISPPASSRF